MIVIIDESPGCTLRCNIASQLETLGLGFHLAMISPDHEGGESRTTAAWDRQFEAGNRRLPVYSATKASIPLLGV